MKTTPTARRMATNLLRFVVMHTLHQQVTDLEVRAAVKLSTILMRAKRAFT